MIIRARRAEIARKAAWLTAEALRQAIEAHDLAVLGVVGGSSIGAVLSSLGQELVDWNRVHLFMVDERLVPLDHPDSNFQLVSAFVEPYFRPDNLHPYRHDPENGEAALERYRQQLMDFGGRFDVALLSAGADGHIASLFPAHETIRSGEKFFLITETAPKPPPGRMSASAQLITASGTALLLFLGPGKRIAFRTYLNEEGPVELCPARLIKNVREHFVLTDCGDEP
ncbi:MAG: 6-phosphogluconolactonase [Desulfofustis sp.]|nr:6-phosphogluconolactonase [Desulfofustis sp.]